jgi:hypothetical protein
MVDESKNQAKVQLQNVKNQGAEDVAKIRSAAIAGTASFETVAPLLLNGSISPNMLPTRGNYRANAVAAADALSKQNGGTGYNAVTAQNTANTQGATQKAFTSGPQGQQLTAIQTAREHMSTFKQTADALDNGDVTALNRMAQALNTQFGSDKATNFAIAKEAFAGEVGKALAGANVGVSDRNELREKILASSSPEQLKGFADTADQLLAGKQKALQESYTKAMQGQPNFGAPKPITATNKQTGERVQSLDGGKTWQPLK